jgi:hypothetical protein
MQGTKNRPIQAIEALTRIAGVPDQNNPALLRQVRRAVTRAHQNSPQLAKLSPSAGALARDFFDPVMKAAKDLQTRLERLQGYHLARGEAARSAAAAHFLAEGCGRESIPSTSQTPSRTSFIRSIFPC